MRDPVLRLQSMLTDRDLVLLGWLADHGVLTSFQIAHALYPSLNYTQRRLRQLLAVEVIDRFRPQRADGGSYPYHYVLAQHGYDVIAAQRGDELPRRDQARRRRQHLTSRANLPHLLGVNDFFTRLAGYARTHPHARLTRWWSAGHLQDPHALQADAGDLLWTFIPGIRPDGHGIFTDNDHTTPFFLEHDTGTETLTQLVDKMPRYHDLGHALRLWWPVLFWLPSPTREHNLHLALTAAAVHYPSPQPCTPHHPTTAPPAHLVAPPPPENRPQTRRHRPSGRPMTHGEQSYSPGTVL